MTGVVFLDKPQGLTSFAAANRVRRQLGAKKAGHTGTLDPMATGAMVIMLGGATRFIDFLPTHDKAYSAIARMGITTDTLDIEGKILTEQNSKITAEQFEKTLLGFLGESQQIPPMYSALKKDGQKLCDLARNGVEIERESRKINIYSLKVTLADEDKQEFGFDVACSAGTYVRSLAADVGEKLGCGAALTSLRRISANGIGIESCKVLEEITADDIRPLEDLLPYQRLTVTAAQARRFGNGGELDRNRLGKAVADGMYCVFSPENVFLGLGEIEPQGEQLLVRRVLHDI